MSDASAQQRRRTIGWNVVLLLAVALVLIGIVGLPGAERTAGDGSAALRHGWAERRARDAAQSPAERTDIQPPAAPTTPR